MLTTAWKSRVQPAPAPRPCTLFGGRYIPKLYAPELMANCKKFGPGHPERPPHTFSMAEAAYMQMIRRRAHQSLVVSGESGAGKTEVNKQCMNYLVWRASSAEHADLSTRILQSNPILEATGNAKTVRNNNSSRFGKCAAPARPAPHAPRTPRTFRPAACCR